MAEPSWDSLPDADSASFDALPDAAPSQEKSLGYKLRKFFDPTYGENRPVTLLDLGKQGLKAGAFLVPGSGAPALLASGGMFGAGVSDATDAGGLAKDAATGAVTGLVGGKALQAAGKYIVAPAAKALKEKSVELGRKALSGIGTPLSARKEIPAAAVEAAYREGAILPFSTVTGIAKRLGIKADEVGQAYAGILSDLEAKGVAGPDATKLALDLLDRASAKRAQSLQSKVPGMFEGAAEELVTKATLPNGRIPLGTAEAIKRDLQAEARREYDKITRQLTSTGEAKKELASVMRQGIEDAVAEQAAVAPQEAAAFLPVKERLANILRAEQSAAEGAARASRRKAVSLTDTLVGSAAGAATANPAVGLGGAFLHGLADRRLASTGGFATRYLAKAMDAMSRQPATAPFGALAGRPVDPRLQAFLDAMRARGGAPGLVPVGADEESSR